MPRFAILGILGLSVLCTCTDAPLSSPSGQIRVYTRTSGLLLDRDGYVVTLDSQQVKTVGPNDHVSFQNVALGRHLAELTGVAQNCLPSDTAVAVTVSAGVDVILPVDVLCMGPVPEDVEIAFVRDGVVHGMRADGSGIVDLTGHFSGDPASSPDGSRLAFVSYHHDTAGDIYVVRADGTGLRQLTRGPGLDREPAWSPDGTKIVFRRGSAIGVTATGDLYLVDLAGGKLLNITQTRTSEAAPSWSPDGSRIAFERLDQDAETTDIFVRMVGDGSEINLTNNRNVDILNREPSWSPDGTTLAFRRAIRGGSSGYDIWLMNSDGTGQHLLIALADADLEPDWSPDGTKILFAGGTGIYQIRPDGTGLTTLTGGGSISPDHSPSWRPRPGGSGHAGRR